MNPDDDEDDMKHEFARKFSTLLSTLCLNFEVLFVANHEDQISTILFQLLIDCTSAKNLQISLSSIDFWDEFKNVIVNMLEIEELAKPEWQYLFKPYVEIYRVLILQAQRSHVKPEQESDLDDIESSTRGLSVAKYREHARDVYFKAYYLLKKVHKQ